MLITIGEAVAYVVSGMYGDVRELGAGNAILIILQVYSQWNTLLHLLSVPFCLLERADLLHAAARSAAAPDTADGY